MKWAVVNTEDQIHARFEEEGEANEVAAELNRETKSDIWHVISL